MKLLARILSHGFAIAIVLLLAVGLIYRGELFPEYNLPELLDIGKLAKQKEKATTAQAEEETPEPETSTSAQATPDDRSQPPGSESQGVSGADRDAAGTTAMPDSPAAIEEPDAIRREPSTETETQPSSGMESATAPVVIVEEVEEVTENQEGTAGSAPVAPEPATNAQSQDSELPESAAPAMDMSEPAVVSGDEAPAAAAQPESGEADTAKPPAKQQENAYALLAAAREAYWLREYEVAESKYQALIRLEPDNPDGYGELGNMYFSQGQWDEAASAYYEAGARLVQQGLLDQAEELVAVIRGLNGDHADVLQEKINAARNASE